MTPRSRTNRETDYPARDRGRSERAQYRYEVEFHGKARHLTESLDYEQSGPNQFYRTHEDHILFAKLRRESNKPYRLQLTKEILYVELGGRPWSHMDGARWRSLVHAEVARLEAAGLDIHAELKRPCYECDRVPPKEGWSEKHGLCTICYGLRTGERCPICENEKDCKNPGCSPVCSFLVRFDGLDAFRALSTLEDRCRRGLNQSPLCKGCFQTAWDHDIIPVGQAERILGVDLTSRPETHHISYEPEITVTLCKACHATVTALRIHGESDPRFDHLVARQDRPEPERTFQQVDCTLCEGTTRTRIDAEPAKPVCRDCLDKQTRKTKLAKCHVCKLRHARIPFAEAPENAICYRCKKRRKRKREAKKRKRKRRAQRRKDSDYIPVRKARKPWKD